MHVTIGTKTFQPMPTGLIWPAICISEESSETKTVIDKGTGLPVDIIVTTADFISLRETKEGEVYTAMTNERVQYGRLSIQMPRFDMVVGLDVTEDGTINTLADIMKRHAVTYGAHQAAAFEARRGAVPFDAI